MRNEMFVFNDMATLTDRDIQIVLQAIDEQKDLAVSLKAASEEL